MSSYLIDEIEWNPRISVRGSSRVVDGGPDDVGHLGWLDLEDVGTGARERVEGLLMGGPALRASGEAGRPPTGPSDRGATPVPLAPRPGAKSGPRGGTPASVPA